MDNRIPKLKGRAFLRRKQSIEIGRRVSLLRQASPTAQRLEPFARMLQPYATTTQSQKLKRRATSPNFGDRSGNSGRRCLFLVLALPLFGAIACSPAPTGPASDPDGAVTLTVSAAASVQDALRDIQVAYQAEAPEVTVVYNFGSSGALGQQIIQGAPVDVFLSASQPWMDRLEAKDVIIAESRRDLLQNAMVLIAPQDAAIASFQDLSTDAARKIAVGEPESVPAGGYAKQVLLTLDLFETLRPKLVFAKDVRQVLSYVETGNVDAGFVYATDAQMSQGVQVLATAPADSHAPIVYPVAIAQDSAQVADAEAFLAFLSTDAATKIFQTYGFGTVDGSH